MLNINEIQLKINDSFIFRRFEKIDWKQIASLNMEQLKASSDWNAIEKNLCNILCCHLESEFNQSNLDPNLCKLFQLAQISIDYLLQVRQQIFNELQTLKEKMQASNLALNAAVKAKEQAEKKLKEMKKDGKRSANQQNYYRCPACPKTFLNGEYLHSHWQRRHPEYVTVIPSTVAASPIQYNSSPILDPITPNKEITELKERLQSAEKQLQNEQNLLHSIMDKMDKSSLSLQGMLAQEVEKLRTTLLEEKVDLTEASYSPKKVQSSSVQTTPRMFQHTMATSTQLERSTPSPERTNIATETKVMEQQATTPTPSIRSVYKTESVKVIQVTPDDQSLSSSTISESDEDQEPRPVIHEKKLVPKVNRQVLMGRFKGTIEKALKQRMRMLGLDARNKTLSAETFLELSENLKSSSFQQRPEFQKMRKHFELQLKERLSSSGKSPMKTKTRMEKPLSQKPLLTFGKTFKSKKESNNIESLSTMQVVTTPPPPRAPVPTPRSRASTSSSLMARDGEALTVSNVKDLSQHLERQMKEAKRVEPPAVNAVNLLPTTPKDSPVKGSVHSQESEEDSFSLSSLDAILTELKKPNRFSQAPTPMSASIKSVQWRVPVEQTFEKETVTVAKGGSWDSFE